VIRGTHSTSGNSGYLGQSGGGVEGRSDSGFGVYGWTNTGYAVRGGHASSGNMGYLATTGTGVEGRSSTGYGVYGWTDSGEAVRGAHAGSGNYGHLGGNLYAVYGKTTQGFGVGVRGDSDVTLGYGGYFEANYGIGLYAEGHANYQAAVFRGDVKILRKSDGATILELGEGLDYAEGFDVSDESSIRSGTVLVIDSDNPGKLKVSGKAYDTRVAGIVAGAKGVGSGVRLGGEQFDSDVALAGRVYCNVDASEAGIQPGDLLTTASLKGYAMKVTDHNRSQGAILGKAMESLEKGKRGHILVLVTLQ
jgi:hypothetical protein